MATLGDFNRVVILLALIALTNSGASNDSFTKVSQHACCDLVVTEGETGTLNFSLRQDSFSSPDFFCSTQTRRREILVCTRRSLTGCHVSIPQYIVDSIERNSLTLRIPNITRDFEGTYILQEYGNGSFQPNSVCRLFVRPSPVVCEDGWYGTSCKLSCGSCLGDQPCNKVTGNCAACKPRRKPPLCQEDVRSADTDKKLQCCVYETMAITAVILCFIFIIVFIRATRTRDTISIYTLNSFDTEPLIDTQMTKV